MSEENRDKVVANQEQPQQDVPQEDTPQEQETPKTEEPVEQQEQQQEEPEQEQPQPNTAVQSALNNKLVARVNNAVKNIQAKVHRITSIITAIVTALLSPVGIAVQLMLVVVLVISSMFQVYGPNSMLNDKTSTEAPNVDFIKGEEREHAIGLYFANNGVNPSASAYLAKAFGDNHYSNVTLPENCDAGCLVLKLRNKEITNLSLGGYQATDTEQWQDASALVMRAYRERKQWYDSSIQLKAMMDLINKLGHTEGSTLFTLDSTDTSGAKTATRQEQDYDLTELVKYIEDNRSVGKMLGSGLGKSRVNGGKASDTSGFGDASYNDGTVKVDGTGTYNPADGSIWTDTRFEPHVARRQIGLPDSIAPYAIDPTKVGLMWSDEASWILRCYDYGNCTDGASNLAYRMWSKDGQPAENVMGNGGQVTSFWQQKGVPKVNTPSVGEVFSVEYGPGLAGHTGLVSHVFEDGTMLIWEQNVAGWSGSENNSPRTWNWRIIPASEWQSGRWSFTSFHTSGWTLKIGYVK